MSKPLRGWMILEDYADDMSHWNGIITGPDDPTGANLAWENPIEMIQVMPDTITISRQELKNAFGKVCWQEEGYDPDIVTDFEALAEELFRPLASDDNIDGENSRQ